MHIHIIIDHPWQKSFNYAILEAFTKGVKQAGHQIDLLDLNRDEFNPVFSTEELALYAQGESLDPKVKDYQGRLLAANHLVMLFPIWWNVMPARLKGWMDKVLLPGFAFTKGQDPLPLINQMQGATVLTTSGAPDHVVRQTYHNALDWVLCKGTLEFCGISPVTWLNFGETGFASQQAHDDWLDEVKRFGKNL